MTKEANIKLFEEKKVRTVWDEEKEEWYFSIVDTIEILTESANPRRYWSDLKIKLEREGSQLYENIVQLKLLVSNLYSTCLLNFRLKIFPNLQIPKLSTNTHK